MKPELETYLKAKGFYKQDALPLAGVDTFASYEHFIYAKNKQQMTVSVSCTTPATLVVRTLDGETFESVDDLLASYAFNPRAVQNLREIEQEVAK